MELAAVGVRAWIHVGQPRCKVGMQEHVFSSARAEAENLIFTCFILGMCSGIQQVGRRTT
eukprot:3420343-Amphidinium_carterae.3